MKTKQCRAFWERGKRDKYHELPLGRPDHCGFDKLLIAHVGDTFGEVIYYGVHPLHVGATPHEKKKNGQVTEYYRLVEFVQDYASDVDRAIALRGTMAP